MAELPILLENKSETALSAIMIVALAIMVVLTFNTFINFIAEDTASAFIWLSVGLVVIGLLIAFSDLVVTPPERAIITAFAFMLTFTYVVGWVPSGTTSGIVIALGLVASVVSIFYQIKSLKGE